MSLYRNLGPITFLLQTDLYEIFSTAQQIYILQLKLINCQQNNLEHNLQHLLSQYNTMYPRIKIQLYTQPYKPQSIILSSMQMYPFNKLSINDLNDIIEAIIKVASGWNDGYVGQINENLFFICDGEVIFFSLPLFVLRKSLKIIQQKEVSQQLLFKRLKQCKTIKEISNETKYFIKIYNLNLQNISSMIESNQVNKHQLQADSKRIRRRYILFKNQNVNKNTKINTNNNSFKQFSFGKQSISQFKRSSKAFHCTYLTNNSSNRSLKLNQSRNYSFKKSTSLLRNNTHSNIRKSQFGKYYQKNIYKHSSTHLEKYKNSNKSSSMHKEQSRKESIKDNIKENTKQVCSKKSIKVDSEEIKKLVHQSFEKWNQRNNLKINLQIPQKNNNSNQNKKKLKKTHHINYQFSQPLDNLKQQQTQLKTEQNNSNIQIQTHNKKITRDMIVKIPLKDQELQFQNKSQKYQEVELDEQTQRKSHNSPNKIKEQINKRFQQQLQQLNLIGETVANTSSYLKSFEDIFWQLPMFFLYKDFYTKRVLIEEDNHGQLKQQNDSVSKSLKKLLTICIKKIKKLPGQGKENLMKHLNMDLSMNSRVFCRFIVKEYIQSLQQCINQYPQIKKHLIQVINAFLVTEGQHINLQEIEKVDKDQSYLKNYLKLKLQHVKLKFSQLTQKN